MRGGRFLRPQFRDPSGARSDLELRDLGAERGPRKRHVDVDDVPARAVRDGLEKIAARTVDLGERDERAAEIVAAAVAEAEQDEIGAEGVLRFGAERSVTLRVGTMKSSSVGARP